LPVERYRSLPSSRLSILAVSEASFPSLFKIAAAAMVLRHKRLVHPGSFDQFAPVQK
jgi:hypothetical protein